jgi:hypothetical protein
VNPLIEQDELYDHARHMGYFLELAERIQKLQGELENATARLGHFEFLRENLMEIAVQLHAENHTLLSRYRIEDCLNQQCKRALLVYELTKPGEVEKS